jgi:hypothetical protein
MLAGWGILHTSWALMDMQLWWIEELQKQIDVWNCWIFGLCPMSSILKS